MSNRPKPQPTVWLVVANDSSMRSLKTVIGKFDTLKEANAYLKEQGPVMVRGQSQPRHRNAGRKMKQRRLCDDRSVR